MRFWAKKEVPIGNPGTSPEPAPVAMPEIPDYVSPIIGWKRWTLKLDTYELWSPIFPTPWPPGKALEETNEGSTDDLNTGIYAVKTREQLELPRGIPKIGFQHVIGEVKLWGKIREGPRGYRASRAYPKSLIVLSKFIDMIRLSEKYGVPVTLEELPEDTWKLPSPIVSEVLEVLTQPIYDTEKVPKMLDGGEGAVYLLTIPVSGNKGIEKTNMQLSGILPYPMKFVISKFSAALFQNERMLPINHELYSRASIDFRIQNKSYWTSPLFMIAHPFSLLGAEKLWRQMDATQRSTFGRKLLNSLSAGNLTQPIRIESGEGFYTKATFRGPVPSHIEIFFALEGEFLRAVI